MKKTLIFISAIALICSTGCDSKKLKEQQMQLDSAQALAEANHEQLMQAIAERDQVISLINEITNTTDDIKNMEKIVAINNNSAEGAASTPQLAANIEAMKVTLEQRRKQIAELESKLRNSSTSNSGLLQTIETLKAQVANQTSEIDSLTSRLNLANEQIQQLDQQVADVTTQRDSVQQIANQQEIEANYCYYFIGSKKELKDRGLLDGGGFLRRDKVNTSNLDKSIFTRADKRTLTSIPLHSDKAKVLTPFQPETSYAITESGGQKVLTITNPTTFWGVSNFVIIQID